MRRARCLRPEIRLRRVRRHPRRHHQRNAGAVPLGDRIAPVHLYTQHGIDCEICWPDVWRVTPADALQRALVERLGAKSAVVEYG